MLNCCKGARNGRRGVCRKRLTTRQGKRMKHNQTTEWMGKPSRSWARWASRGQGWFPILPPKANRTEKWYLKSIVSGRDENNGLAFLSVYSQFIWSRKSNFCPGFHYPIYGAIGEMKPMWEERVPNPSMTCMDEKNGNSSHITVVRVPGTGHSWFRGLQPETRKTPNAHEIGGQLQW